MQSPFYRGWGLRNAITGLIKRSVTSITRGPQQAAIYNREDQISTKLRDLGLDRKEGLERLSSQIVSAALEHAEIDESLAKLPFLRHVAQAVHRGLEREDLFSLPSSRFDNGSAQRSAQWEIEDALDELHHRLDNLDELMDRYAYMIGIIIKLIVSEAPSIIEAQWEPSSLTFSVPLPMVMNELPELIEAMVQFPLTEELQEDKTTKRLGDKIYNNLLAASGGVAGDPSTMPRNPKLPTNSPFASSAQKLVQTYLGGTYFENILSYSVPISIPQQTRFEHHHIVAGTGHGKTQTLQHLILNDLRQVAQGGASIVVLDSQGDLIDKIKNLEQFAPGGPLHGKLVVIDPKDIEYPVALNLFDVGMDRINEYSALDREQSINSVLELYDFVLGSLLDAQMTQKQSVLFRYITRLMLNIPDATIATFKDLLSNGGTDLYREHINKLQGSARDFFETEFDSKEFVQTKRQVLRRLWGILENQTFERMFLHPKSKLDIYAEMNAGKVILINTAKDLLKEQGTEFFGRFFIAMIAQAAQERSVIPEDKRMPTFVYIDEAADYFDRNIGIILSQARKYKVGMVLAHQYLGQLDKNLQEAVFSNTSIKFAGGVSNQDARKLAAEMRTDHIHIEGVDKLEMATFIRGTTKRAISINITYGEMERLPKMSDEQKSLLLAYTRNRYAVHYSEILRGAEFERSDAEDDQPEQGTSSNETTSKENAMEATPERPKGSDSKPTENLDPTDPKPWG